MYRKIYRQEGGLAEEGYRAQLRQAREKAIEDWNRRTKGEVAQKVKTPVRKPPISQRIKKGISSLVPDTVKNIAAIPINVFNALGGGDTGYMSPEMIEATRQAALNAIERTGQDKNVTMDYMDYIGAPDYLDAGRYGGGFPQIFKEGGTGAGAASLTFGGATVNKDPATGEISFTPGSGDYDMSDNNPIWLGGLPGWLGLSDKNPMNVPMESFIDPDYTAAKQLGDIEAQVDPYDQGLASLPEAQADEPWYTDDWDTFVSKRREDPDTDLQYRGPEVSYVPEAQVQIPNKGLYFFNPGDLADVPKAQTEQPFKSDITIQQPTGWEGTGYGQPSPQQIEKWNAIVTSADLEWAMNQYALDNISQPQPTGWEGTGYGGLADLQASLTNYPTGSIYFLDPTGRIYPGHQSQDTIDTINLSLGGYKDIPYSTQLESGFGGMDNPYSLDEYYRVHAQPTGFEGTGYGQFSPQPAGGVYTPTGNIGLRPAGTTPTNINTRPYQPLAAY